MDIPVGGRENHPFGGVVRSARWIAVVGRG